MKKENSLDTDQIRGLVWRLAFPSMLAQFVSVLYSIVDRMYIGNIAGTGGLALAGVGVCGPIVTLITSFASWIGVGGAPLMSIRLGQKNERGARQIVANCFCLLLSMAVAIMVLAYSFKDYLLTWFGASQTIFPYANEYLSWYLAGTVFALLSTGMCQFIICQGFAKTGMFSVIIGAAANIALDPVFIFVLGMGVRGAAVATVISQMASCAFVLWFLLGKRPLVPITFGRYRKRVMKQVLVVGLSPFLIIASDSVLIIMMNTIIQHYGGELQGDMLLTCNTIVQSFMLMITMPLGEITGGTQTIMGYNYGAGRPDRIRRAEKHIVLLGLVFTSVMFLIANTIPQYFVSIFTRDPEYTGITSWAIRVYTMCIIPLAVQYTVVDGFTGMGIAKVAVSLSMFRKLVYMIGMLALPYAAGAQAIFYAEPISDIVAAVVSFSTYLLLSGKILKDGRRF
ncbi:MAG: MATE family efflux transporter [Clostridium sp.]|nr:MATE family efflux transporter [Clostridium sp.]